MPWRTIYVLSEHFRSEELRYHEMIHIEQLERDGSLRFCTLYLYYLIRYGYRRNPYEIEAYDRTHRAFSNAGNERVREGRENASERESPDGHRQ